MIREPIRFRRVAAALAVAILACLTLGACDRILGPREWTMSSSGVDGTQHTIRVRDTSGRIENVEIDPVEPVEAGDAVTNPPGQPNVVIVPWLGGACDTLTDIAIEGSGAGLAITVTTTMAPGVCRAVGVPHELRVSGAGPLPAGSVQVRQLPSS